MLPNDEGWTPDEIETCCNKASRWGLSLFEAAKTIVPSCQSAPDKIEELRLASSERFLSASYPGPYKYSTLKVVEEGIRAIKGGITPGQA